MPIFEVNWHVQVEADSPEDAARQALAIQRRRDSIAQVFEVTSADGETLEVDLLDEPPPPARQIEVFKNWGS